MLFTHLPYEPDDTIAAIATPPGEGGVAMVRLSGKLALQIAAKIFTGPLHQYKTHTAHYGQVFNLAGEKIDDVLLLPLLGKRSYTGEDTIEIFCHGGSLITRRVLETVLEAGARAARPGEFTFKAFMNGKLDLAQAEAVQTLIAAKNHHALAAAENQLNGSLSKKISAFQTTLTHITAILEAWIDFPEEGLEFATTEELSAQLDSVAKEMQELLDTFQQGRMLQEGIILCLVGCPNAGKSSLMNALLDKERAIVSHIPGTTRDVLEDTLYLNGLHLRLVDTAGIRDSIEVIEQEGIRRSKKAMEEADLVLLVLDAAKPLEQQEHELISLVPKNKTLLVWNKIDLEISQIADLKFPHCVSISAKEKIGLDDLRKKIDTVIWEKVPPSKDEILITNLRHKESLANAIEACRAVMEGLSNQLSPEFLAQDMRCCLKALGQIIGKEITEEILSAIFSKFCIGK